MVVDSRDGDTITFSLPASATIILNTEISMTKAITIEGVSVAYKNELLFNNGINFNTLPNWQRRGVGVFWESYSKAGHNPITNESVMAEQRRLTTQLDLPMKDDYAHLLGVLLDSMDS